MASTTENVSHVVDKVSTLLEGSSSEVDRADFIHTPCYCEENVYLLINQLAEAGLVAADLSDLFVTFVSNASKQIVMWRQRAGVEPDGLCVWDYHVFLVQRRTGKEGGSRVWDLDTTLPFPTPFETYYADAFRPDVRLLEGLERRFRVTPAADFLRHFSSDRSHMRRPDGSWAMPPPAYDPILKKGALHTLAQYLDMSTSEDDGADHAATTIQDVSRRRIESSKTIPRTLGVIVTEREFSYLLL